jgi:hypothetical protein
MLPSEVSQRLRKQLQLLKELLLGKELQEKKENNQR